MMLLLILYVFTSTPEVALQDIQLLGSPDGVPNAGRVQVIHTNNIWRDVCHDGNRGDEDWSITEAMVACRQLGYPGTALSRKGGYGNGNGDDNGMDDYRCYGYEMTLFECYSAGEAAGECDDGNDAGVICTVPGYLWCYRDHYGSVLPDAHWNDETMTVEKCIDYCTRLTNPDMRYAGVRDRSHCFCGIEDTDYDYWGIYRDYRCDTTCAGNDYQICGGTYYGIYYISIYDLNLGKCQDPSPTDGSTMEQDFSFGKWVTFTCDPNYELVGETTLQCILGSAHDECMWSGEPPTCEYTLLPTTQTIPTTSSATTSTIPTTKKNVPVTQSQRPSPNSPTPLTSTGTPGPSSTAVAGPRDPQQGAPAVGTIIGATLGSLLALILMVLLMVMLLKKKRNNKSTSATTPTAFVGPYDLTIDTTDSQHVSSSDNNQPVYSNINPTTETSSKKQPVYANTNPLDPSSEEVYHEVTETSTDEDYVTVHSTVEDDTSDSKWKSNHNNKPVSVVYAKAQKTNHNEPNDREEGSLYYARSDLSQVAAGSKQAPGCNGDGEEGWEDNIAYSGFQGDGQKVHEDGYIDTEGWEDNDLYSTTSTNEEVIKVVEATDNNEEGWEDNVLYATRSVEADGGVDVEDEGWEDNVIYAGSDDE